MKERFTAKMGPLPVWAWGAIIGVVIVAGVWWSGKKKGATATPGTVGTGTISGIEAFDKSYAAAGGGQGASGTGTGTTSDTGYTSNQSWLSQGVKLLIGQGVAPVDAEKALDAYLTAGQGVTTQQTDWINSVIAALGLPPQGTLGPINVPAETVTGGTTGDATLDAASQQITALYQQYLGRGAGTSEINSWLATGGDYNAIKSGIENSPEATNLAQRNTVISWYQKYLGRTPSPGEINQYQAAIKAGNSAAAEASIANGPEAAAYNRTH